VKEGWALDAVRATEPSARFSRRAVVKRGVALAIGGSFVVEVLTACDGGSKTAQQPSVFAPVFYGWQEVGRSEGAPGRLRLWYPSLEGSPQDATVLGSSFGGFPLVLFLHGQCAEQTDHYQTWSLLPAELARSGYVAAVPDLPDTRTGSPPWSPTSTDLMLVDKIVNWLRSGWTHRDRLLPSTAVVGHSFGALLGSRIAARRPSSASAYVSIAGFWPSWDIGVAPMPLAHLSQPALFMWGDSDISADMLAPPSSPLFERVPRPKHRIVFRGGEHWDHWRSSPRSTIPCEPAHGTCEIVGKLTADFTATFLTKYMPPEHGGTPSIDDDLRLPKIDLTSEQQFYAGGHLPGLNELGSPMHAGCLATHTWATQEGPPGSGSDWSRR
jgi:pimeloyl-ACP methyl ester carboxylesterase